MPAVQVNVIPGTQVQGTVLVPTQVQVNAIQPTQLVTASTPGASSDLDVFGETPMGAINGSNATFTTMYSFVPESVRIMVNGIRLKLIDEYTTSGLSTINLQVSPEVNDLILMDYKKI